jgi:hypothetical protein
LVLIRAAAAAAGQGEKSGVNSRCCCVFPLIKAALHYGPLWNSVHVSNHLNVPDLEAHLHLAVLLHTRVTRCSVPKAKETHALDSRPREGQKTSLSRAKSSVSISALPPPPLHPLRQYHHQHYHHHRPSTSLFPSSVPIFGDDLRHLK